VQLWVSSETLSQFFAAVRGGRSHARGLIVSPLALGRSATNATPRASRRNR
jgi:hypothetical protein